MSRLKWLTMRTQCEIGCHKHFFKNQKNKILMQFFLGYENIILQIRLVFYVNLSRFDKCVVKKLIEVFFSKELNLKIS